MQNAVLSGDASHVEEVASTSGADAASVLCYLHPAFDGKQPGGCPTMYFRDETAKLKDLQQFRMWVAMEAASGIVPQHDYDPESRCRMPGFNGCFSWGDVNHGAWWNVTADPFDEHESPLWAFTKFRALNRLALRTKLNVIVKPTSQKADSSAYYTYRHQNCYEGRGGQSIDHTPAVGLTDVECMERCDNDSMCECVTYCASCNNNQGACWKRSRCEPAYFQNDDSKS